MASRVLSIVAAVLFLLLGAAIGVARVGPAETSFTLEAIRMHLSKWVPIGYVEILVPRRTVERLPGGKTKITDFGIHFDPSFVPGKRESS